MHCPACGAVLTRKTKYCKQCGTQLAAGETPTERFDSYLTDLFWTAVFACGIIVGGLVLLKKVLDPGQGILIGYLILSSLAFLIIFGLSLWQLIQLLPAMKRGSQQMMDEPFDTNRLGPAQTPASLTPASVTEETTRTFETVEERVKR